MNGGELVGLACVLITGFLLVRAGHATVGEATAAALYFHRAFDPVGMLFVLVDDFQEAASALTRLAGVTTLEPAHKHHTASNAQGIRLAAIHHAYVDDHPVLHGVDLHIEPGERVALIGTTGAGKTTIARIAAGLERPTDGTVEVGGDVGLVTQEVHVFADPLRPTCGWRSPTRRTSSSRPRSTVPARAGATSCSTRMSARAAIR